MQRKPKSKTVKQSRVTLNALMTPADQNYKGFVFGGVILKMIDHAAYVCARKHSGNYCVTASFDHVIFKKPIRVGDLVTVAAEVNFAGRTSMEIGIEIISENLETKKVEHANSSYVTMVAVDSKGNPVKVPRLIPQTAEEKRRYKEAEKRYLARKKGKK